MRMPSKHVNSTIPLLVIAVSVLALGAAGVFLLRRNAALERESLAAAHAETRRAVATAFAERIKNVVTETEISLVNTIRRIPADDLIPALREMQDTDPLARNVFVWKRGEGLLWPCPDSATADEREFMRRNSDLFAPNTLWGNHLNKFDESATAKLTSNGSIPNFHGSQLYLLAWTRVPSDNTLVAGVEIETAALFGFFHRLFNNFPPDSTINVHLRNGMGAALFSSAGSGGFEAEIPLSPALPHWTLAFAPNPDTGETTRRQDDLPIALALLFASLLVSIGAGTLLIARDARRQSLDALRKTTFVSNVSHELRTPLTNIRMYAELLSDGKAEDGAQAGKFTRVIADESRRLSALVSDVLEFGRNKPVRVGECDVGEIAKEFGNLEIGKLGNHMAFCNPDAVRQIIINLTDNARKYAGDEPEIEITSGADTVSVSVSDRGPGIPPRFAKRIFEPFFRADESNTAASGGFGLGLAIARKLAADMGGTLTHAPRSGGGSVFTLTLGKQFKGSSGVIQG